MKITPLNEFNTLFMVEDVYPSNVIDECIQQDVANMPWEPLGDAVYSQADTPRRMIISEKPNVFATLNDYISELIPEVREITQQSISHSHTRVWADYPRYDVPRHLDNKDGVYITLQVYLNNGDIELGTHFSNSNRAPYQHAIPYKANFGYIMVNTDYNFHGMIKPVPKDFIRLSSYTWFGA